MSDQGDNTTPQRRRMSLVDMFSGRPNMSSSPPSTAVQPTPDTAQHKRGTSISVLGSAPNAFAKQRRASVSNSSTSSSPEFRNVFGDEPAVIEEDETSMSNYGSPPSPSFARRVSFGAQALRDVRQSTGAAGGGEGFNWSEALRDKSKRAPSFSSGNPFGTGLGRAKSGASAGTVEPPKEIPKVVSPPPTKMKKKPDHLGERMLRGDFMMD